MTSTDNTEALVLRTDGPDSPAYIKQVAAHLAESARVLNHVTLGHRAAGSLRYPADADYVLAEVASAVQRLPQLVEQILGWLENEYAAGRTRVTYGQFEEAPSAAVLTVQQDLVAASNHLGRAYEALDRARQVTATISAPYDPAEVPDA